MSLRFESLTGEAIASVIDGLADLRIRVFREWPYLYDGDTDYEREYLRGYQTSAGAIVVAARDGTQLVGAATGLPLETADPTFGTALAISGMNIATVFYCAESVLLPAYRGRGTGHRFFDLREAHASTLGFQHAAFCSVIRPDDHPARPAAHRPLERFWRKRGYAPCDGAVAHLAWRDVGDAEETHKPLQFWTGRI